MMQPVVTEVRSHLTSNQVVALLRDEPSIVVGAGCELLNQNLDVLEDISSDLLDGSVSRSNYATIHGVAQLAISRELPWGRAIVRPYMTIESGSTSARFNLGAYFTNTPARVLGATPITYDVQCFDLLDALNTPAGVAYSVPAGSTYLNAVKDILINQGFTKFVIDQRRATTTLSTAKVWPLEEKNTWLAIVNDLLAAVGYRGIWVDWNGYLRCEAYVGPSSRQIEWAYNSTIPNTMLGETRTYTRDFYEAPNRWVAVRANDTAGATPVEGAGIYTYVNQNVGETSVTGRGGRVITRILSLDAADQAALIAQTQAAVEIDLNINTKIQVETSPNPLHWHFDVVSLTDAEAGVDLKLIESSWNLPLLGGDMSHEWSKI